jgi:chromosome segregation ATPase
MFSPLNKHSLSNSLGSLASPLKGLERMQEELRIEREKATSALQDRARIRVELDSCKQRLDYQIKSNEQCQSDINSLEETNNELCKDNAQQIDINGNLKLEVNHLNRLLEESNSKITSQEAKKFYLAQELSHANEKLLNLIANNDGLEDRMQAIKDSSDEISQQYDQMQIDKLALETKLDQVTKSYHECRLKSEDMHVQIRKAEHTTESLTRLKASASETQRELSSSVETTTNLDIKLRDSIRLCNEKEAIISNLENSIMLSDKERENLLSEISNLEEVRIELSKKAVAETEIALFQKQRADTANRGKEFTDQQIDEMNASHAQILESNTSLESQLSFAKSNISSLQTELNSFKEKNEDLEIQLVENKGAQAMATEVECLRQQLSTVRKQLVKRDMEDDAQVSPRAVIEREQHSRGVYEGIILDLRTELDIVTNKYHETSQRLEDVGRKAARIEQLEDEIEIYRDTAKISAVENHSVSLSASEAVERSVKTLHEKNIILRDLRTAEIELQATKSELLTKTEELQTEKHKHKVTTLEKLSAERKAAELLAVKAKVESELDSMSQLSGSGNLELERLKRSNNDNIKLISELKLKCSDNDRLRSELSQSELAQSNSKNETIGKEQELRRELSMLRQSKSTYEREMSSLKQNLTSQKRCFDESLVAIDKMRRETEMLRLEKDNYRRDVNLLESSKAESQLTGLRRDLEQTVNDWKGSERDRIARDDANKQLNGELSKERERNSLLKTQVSLLDERLKISYQELSVYRSLDVYHTSLQSGLSSHRQSNRIVNESPGQSPSKNYTSDYYGSESRSKLPSSSSITKSQVVPISAHSSSTKYNGGVNEFDDNTDGRLSLADMLLSPPFNIINNNHDNVKREVEINTTEEDIIETETDNLNKHYQSSNNSTKFQPSLSSRLSIARSISPSLSVRSTSSASSKTNDGKPMKSDFERARRLLAKSGGKGGF